MAMGDELQSPAVKRNLIISWKQRWKERWFVSCTVASPATGIIVPFFHLAQLQTFEVEGCGPCQLPHQEEGDRGSRRVEDAGGS